MATLDDLKLKGGTNISLRKDGDKVYIDNDYDYDPSEIEAEVAALQGEVGTLSNLTTTVKTDLVSAINELDANKLENTNYATNSVAGVVKTGTYGFGVNSSGIAFAENVSYATYQDRHNTWFISKGTLENVITGKGLVSNTDYATSSTGGVVKIGYNGTGFDSNNRLKAETINYETYNSQPNHYFISKGTLENVIVGKDLTTKAYVDELVGDIETILETLDVGSGV